MNRITIRGPATQSKDMEGLKWVLIPVKKYLQKGRGKIYSNMFGLEKEEHKAVLNDRRTAIKTIMEELKNGN